MFDRVPSIRQHVYFTPEKAFESWADLAAAVTIVVAVGISLFEHGIFEWRFWFALVFATAYFLIGFCVTTDNLPWLRNFKIALLTSVPVSFILLGINGWGAVLMFFILSALVMYQLPSTWGYFWICGFGLFTIVIYATIWADIGSIFAAIGTFAGFLFFGSAAEAQLKAMRASAESRRLLQELQDAHRRLQAQAAQAEELAASQERNRLAREVHDTLGHRLSVAAVQLEAVQKLISRDPDKARTMAENVYSQVLEGLQELRRTVSTLRAPLEEDLPLANALTRLVHTFEEATDIEGQLTLKEPLPELPAGHRHALYRATQEALTNVQKHAQARHVSISLRRERDHVVLRVADDGRGMKKEQNNQGFGLRGLKERAVQLGGRAKVASRTGRGTEIIFSIPVDELNRAPKRPE